MTSLIFKLFEPAYNSLRTSYRGLVASKITPYGLRFDDLLDPLKDEDVAEALRRLPPNIVVERNCRLRRAIDLSMKKETLPYDLQAKQTPDEHYLADVLAEVRAERRERAALGAPAPYTRIYY